MNARTAEQPPSGPPPCSTDFSDGPCDQQPPATRENAIEIAADLVRQVDCNHRPLACEAARKLKALYDDNRRQIALTNDMRELMAVCERAALAMCHHGIPDDGSHPLSEAMVHLRVVRTEKFENYWEKNR